MELVASIYFTTSPPTLDTLFQEAPALKDTALQYGAT